MTAVIEEDIAGAFNAALAEDAGLPGPVAEDAHPAPPARAEAPAAPARPAPKPKPTRAAKRDAAARTAPPVTAPSSPSAPVDYTADLIATGEQVWFAASMVRGGKIGPVSVPDLRPYAAVFRGAIPQQAAAWNAAAQQNANVRRVVSRLAGDGGVSWVIGVGIATAGLVSACAALASAPAEVREQLTAANDAALDAYVQAMIAAAGLAPEGDGAE